MFFRTYRLWLSLLLISCCLVGFYYLQADTGSAPSETSVSDSRRLGSPDGILPHSPLRQGNAPPLSEKFHNDLNSDFYQTIIKNNLFAPLGTDLHGKFVPGANLRVVGTFVTTDPLRSRAVLKNETTGEHHVLGIGGVLGDFTVMKIQPKQVTLDHHGKKPVVLHLPEPVFLN